MKQVTKDLIKQYNIKDIDFMGYKKNRNDIFTFHHLLVPARYGGPYEEWNGAILCGKTSHPYLHLIEHIDNELFLYLTDLIIEEKRIGALDYYVLKEMDNSLSLFEKKHEHATFKNKKRILKPEYLYRDYSSLK